MRLNVCLGDITTMHVDGIVNAANETLLGGGGVDGAIHRAAGPELLEECKMLHGCSTGNVKITKRYNLFAKYILHAVGPKYIDGSHQEPELLASCYYQCMLIAYTYNMKSIAFPCISTGTYGYPKEEACEIAVRTVSESIRKLSTEEKMYIYFVCFDRDSYHLYQKQVN